jgi:hypothetical protein
MKKEIEKQHIINMIKGDKELGLYKEEKQETTLEEAAERYAHNYFNMHETNNYKALKQGYEAGAKEMAERMYSEEDMIEFAEFIMLYPNKNKNYLGQILHSKSKYDGAERTIDLLKEWFEQFKKK